MGSNLGLNQAIDFLKCTFVLLQRQIHDINRNIERVSGDLNGLDRDNNV